jgi:hypothetical protein
MCPHTTIYVLSGEWVVGQEQRVRAGGGAGARGERSRAAAVEGGVVAGV